MKEQAIFLASRGLHHTIKAPIRPIQRPVTPGQPSLAELTGRQKCLEKPSKEPHHSKGKISSGEVPQEHEGQPNALEEKSKKRIWSPLLHQQPPNDQQQQQQKREGSGGNSPQLVYLLHNPLPSERLDEKPNSGSSLPSRLRKIPEREHAASEHDSGSFRQETTNTRLQQQLDGLKEKDQDLVKVRFCFISKKIHNSQLVL
jgi:hypothetical protein